MAPSEATSTPDLHYAIRSAAEEAGAKAVAVAFHDYGSRTAWCLEGDRSFHAASTIKVAVLAVVYALIDEGEISPLSRLHVRNRFASAADGSPYRVGAGRDANAAVHAQRGKTMRIGDLAHHMITTSSNLATNLLLDLAGVERARELLDRMQVTGVDLRRGVEDEKAFEAGINNRVTAAGLVSLFRAIHEGEHHSEESRDAMLETLHAQEFRSAIPAGVPDGTRVAHKTGEISTVSHDAGIVTPSGRDSYVLAVLTEWEPDNGSRRETIARISRLVYDHLDAVAALEQVEGEGDDE